MIFFGSAVAGLAALIAGLAVFARALPDLEHSIQLIALPAQALLYLFLYFALWCIFRLKYNRPVWASLAWVRTNWPLWQAFLLGCLLSLAVGLLGTALKIPQVKSPFDRFLHQPVWIVIFGLFAILLGPLFEEIVFRGFIQPLLMRDLGGPAGVLITAFVFGLLHAPEYSGAWQYVLLITFVGVCLGVARLRGRSLVPAFVMHAGFNSVFFVAALAQLESSK